MASEGISPALPGAPYVPKPNAHEVDRRKRERNLEEKRKKRRRNEEKPASDPAGVVDPEEESPAPGEERRDDDVPHVDIRAARCRMNDGISTTWMFVPGRAGADPSREAQGA